VRRDSNQTQKECRPSEVFLGDARTGDPKIPEPSHPSGAVIEEMIAPAKDMQRANERGATLKLNEEELAFYDARNQRQRRASSRRRNFTNYSALVDRRGPQKRHRRLDHA
jgi:Type I restriction enzyme HindI endonuclease subunit-like, C-terminal